MRRRGSTLIELLVVVAIIAVLLGMLLPSLRHSIRLANNTICQHNLRELSLALRIYRAENSGWLPVSEPVEDSIVAQVGEVEQPDVWFMKLHPDYLNNPGFLACPEDPYGYRLRQARNLGLDPKVANFASYGLNSFLITGGKGLLANVDRFEPSRPGDTILLADLGPDNVGGSRRQSSNTEGPPRNQSLLSWGDGFDVFDGASNPWLTARHNDGINVITLGGGIRQVNTRQIMRRPISDYYQDCGDAGCTLCRELSLYHYSFAQRRLFWWTGSLPELAVSRVGQ